MEMSEKIAYLEVAQARLEERVEDLEEWRRKVNGSFDRLEEKYEKIQTRLNNIGWSIAATLGGVVVAVAVVLSL